MNSEEFIEITVLRKNPGSNEEQYKVKYKIPTKEVITVLDALDYIRRNFDSSLAYYSHQACGHGMCGVCTLKVNGKPKLACQTKVEDGMIIEPLINKNILVDLVNKI